MKIITKLTDYIQKVMKSMQNRKYDKMTMRVVLFYLFFIVLLLLTWYGTWLYMFTRTGIADLDALSKFIVICTGATAFWGFIIRCFIDKNHNGIPDMFEEKQSTTVTTSRPVVIDKEFKR